MSESSPIQGALITNSFSMDSFNALSGVLGGTPFVKLVLERTNKQAHFLNNNHYQLHAAYIAEKLIKLSTDEVYSRIDEFNNLFYHQTDRPYFLGILARHQAENNYFFTLETVEVDSMDGTSLIEFYKCIRDVVDASYRLFLKPANIQQEAIVRDIPAKDLPRIFDHEMSSSKHFIPLNAGKAQGRIRLFNSIEQFRDSYDTIRWYDILVMDRIPEDIPRIQGIINSNYTTPLSHTNVLAHGWEIPNSVWLEAKENLQQQGMINNWVEYTVGLDASEIEIKSIPTPTEEPPRPHWTSLRIQLESPQIDEVEIKSLDQLRHTDRDCYGTKAANIGEMLHLLKRGSTRMIGYYNVQRPPRENLRSYLANYLKCGIHNDLEEKALEFFQNNVRIPRGIALPFSLQRTVLEKHPAIQQQIGRLKLALELDSERAGAICVQLQNMIRKMKLDSETRDLIDAKIVKHLAGASHFVVRSSSNAEDLENFSAAGIYESHNNVATADKVFAGIKNVWASLVSPRSTRLRQEVGISLEDAYMGVIIQEQINCDLGGVMVTSNPTKSKGDFRNVYINVSPNSAVNIVDGSERPIQFLYNTVEGGGKTLSLGSYGKELDEKKQEMLQRLAFVGRILQSHFSADYQFNAPQDIEWVISGNKIYILQIRPYAH